VPPVSENCAPKATPRSILLIASDCLLEGPRALRDLAGSQNVEDH